MYATHVHPKAQKEKGKAWEVADTSCAFQLTAFEKCCNITKSFSEIKVHFLRVYTCIQMRRMHFINVRRQKKSKELKRCLNILQNVSVWR